MGITTTRLPFDNATTGRNGINYMLVGLKQFHTTRVASGFDVMSTALTTLAYYDGTMSAM